jgi:choline dehydrogenase-like flavoprotein
VRELETDYLIVGAGASGMAFADAVLARTDAHVVLVDRRHAPGGHWLDAYPFVRLHQPSAYYGVDSRPLGHDLVDEHGPNAGFYERASAAEICAYYGRVLDDLRGTGRASFLGASCYRGDRAGLHRVVSLLDGEETTVRVRRRLDEAARRTSSRRSPRGTCRPSRSRRACASCRRTASSTSTGRRAGSR